MSLLFGYAPDLELVQEDVDMDGNRIVDLPELGKQKYVDHEITKKMFLNNMDFYNDVRKRRFDIRLFEQSFRKRKVSVAGYWVSSIRKSVEGCGRNGFVGEVGAKLQSTVLVVCNGSQNHLIKG